MGSPEEYLRVDVSDARELIKVLVKALEAVEWQKIPTAYKRCPECFAWESDGHKPNCQLNQALKIARHGLVDVERIIK